MGAINFNPALVMERLSREREAEFSRLAALAGGQGEIRPVGAPPEPQDREAAPAKLANLLIPEIPAARVGPANPANLLNSVAPSEWSEGLARLDPNRPPVGIAAPLWRGAVRDAELFLATWGKQAADLGWTTLDLFGAHPRAPGARYSCMGLLLLIRGGRVVALTADSAAIEQQSGARLTYTRQPIEAECMPLWRLVGVAGDSM